jgi:phospholipid/cholesterol/gamma-HCH transport system substrate-binding protein
MSVKNFRERSPVLIGILSIIGITIGMGLAFSIDKLPFVKQAYEIKAQFANAAGLNPENQVRVAGIKVGTVKSLELQKDRVLVTMEIDNGVEIPDDTIAEIKLATILGTKFVQIRGKGSEPYLADGDTIPLERTAVPYEIYQASNEGTGVLEGLDGPALNNMLRELGNLVDITRDELGAALSGLNDLGTSLNSKQDELRSLLSETDELTAFLADEGDEIVQLVDASNVVLQTLVEERDEIQSLLDTTQFTAKELTEVLKTNRGNVEAIITRLSKTLDVLADNVEALDVALAYSGSSSRYFAKVFSQGRWGDIYECAIIVTHICEQDE